GDKAALGAAAQAEASLFVQHIFGSDGGWRDVLTSTEAFVNEDSAPLYGVEGVTGQDFTRVNLPVSERRGIFTQLGFLAANATSMHPDPIHRGVFLSSRIACNQIAAPPDDIPTLPEPSAVTNRQMI